MTSRAIHRGKYRLIAEIGRGGMAEVYLALLQGDLGFNKLVVVKQIREDMASDPELMTMFLDEARLAARLRHPNVVETHEVVQENGRTFMAMEYLEGQPLHRVIQRAQASGGIPLAIHLRMLSDMLAGLHHAHELLDWDDTPLCVVHRDVTPQNVFVSYEGAVKIVDFGIAKVRGAITQTRANIVKGKIAYLAPEQARREDLDRRVDIFAAGVMLWEAVTGTRPWKGRSEYFILERLMAGRFPAARTVCPNIDLELEDILNKALAAERIDRYATAAEFRAAIEAYLEKLGEHVDMREFGKQLATQFADDRQRIHDEMEKAIHVDPTDGHLVTGNLPRLTPPPPLPTTPPAAVTSLHERTTPTRAPMLPPSSRPPPRHLTPSAGSSFTALAGPTLSPDARPRTRSMVMIGTLAAAAFAVALWAPWRSTAAVASAPATASNTLECAAPAPAPPNRVALNVRAFPQEAKIYFDEQPLPTNPFASVYTADHEVHRLRIEAPGFVTRNQALKLEQDTILELALLADKDDGSEPAAGVASAARKPADPARAFVPVKVKPSADPALPYDR